jgi:hypothetical protein
MQNEIPPRLLLLQHGRLLETFHLIHRAARPRVDRYVRTRDDRLEAATLHSFKLPQHPRKKSFK